MDKDCIKNSLEILEPLSFDLSDTPRINLSSSEDVRREMARVYRETRSMRIPASDGTKLVFILCQILKAHEIYSIEKRLEVLEQEKLKIK
jgi:hypothetical protein